MRGGGGAAALGAGVVLLLGACTLSTSSSNGQASPSTAASPSTESSPSTSATATPGGGASSSPSSSATTTPAGTPLAVAALPFHNGEVGLGYGAVTLGASGGTPPYSWSISAGSLPAGLGLSSGGVVSGTPSAAGHPSFTVTVHDSAGGSASAGGSINVFAPLSLGASCASLCSVEEGCTVCGAFGSVGGGASPYRFTIVGGAVPSGMGLNGLTVTGPFPAPGPLGSFNLTVAVTDQLGVQGQVTANWFVFTHISFAGGSIPKCPYTGCSVQFPYLYGTPNGAVSVSVVISAYSQTCVAVPNCPPPPDLVSGKAATNGNGGVVTITVSRGQPDPAWMSNGWTGTLSVILTDSSPCGPGNCNTGPVGIPITLIAG